MKLDEAVATAYFDRETKKLISPGPKAPCATALVYLEGNTHTKANMSAAEGRATCERRVVFAVKTQTKGRENPHIY